MATDPLEAAWNSSSTPTDPTSKAATNPDAALQTAGGSTAPVAKAAAPSSAPAGTAQDVLTNTGVAPTSGGGTQQQSEMPATGTSADNPPPYLTPTYGDAVQKVQTATDPQQLLAHQDTLARSVMSNLQAAGHDVQWDGQHLTVDGRPYEIAGQDWTTPANDTPGFDYGWDFAAHAGQSTAANPNTPKYQVASVLQKFDPNDPNWAPVAAAILNQEAAARGLPQSYKAESGTRLSYAGNEWVDTTKQAGQFFWGSTSQNGGGGAGGTGGAGSGVDLSSLWPGGTPPAAGTSSGTAMLQGLGGNLPDYNSMWGISPTSVYTPSAIGEADQPGYDQTLAASQQNPMTQQTDDYIKNLLAHPESLDQHTVDMMEAKDAEEQQQAAQSQDTALKRFGFQSGITDSPWLASERAATARAADAATIGNRRNIELTAAQTNKADQRAAAQIGSTYQGQRSQQQIQSVSNAVDAAMKKAQESSNRFSINENLKVEAAKLSLSADQLREQWVNDTLTDMTKRYGIDMSVKVDAAKLADQSDEFKADLMYRLAALAEQARQANQENTYKYSALNQQDAQFGANLGFNYDELNANQMNQYWNGTTAS